jgi:anaphase-promoting complex subunit 6
LFSQGNLLEAVESFHKALGIRRDDTFSTSMLNNVIEQLMSDDLPFRGDQIGRIFAQ